MHKTTESFVKADIIIVNHSDGSIKFVTLPENIRKGTIKDVEKYLSNELKLQMELCSWMRNPNRIFRISNYDEEIY